MEHTASDTGTLICPFCESWVLKDFGRNSARCGECGGLIGGEFLQALRRIVALPDAVGRHACECGHPEMRLLPDNVYRCPSCGAEVLPPSAENVSWLLPGRSEAYCHGWLTARYGEPGLLLDSRSLARWDAARDRLDFYRGHRAGREARVGKGRLLEAS